MELEELNSTTYCFKHVCCNFGSIFKKVRKCLSIYDLNCQKCLLKCIFGHFISKSKLLALFWALLKVLILLLELYFAPFFALFLVALFWALFCGFCLLFIVLFWALLIASTLFLVLFWALLIASTLFLSKEKQHI